MEMTVLDKPVECYVALLDILGFGNFVNTQDPERVRKYMIDLVKMCKLFNVQKFNLNVNVFSDSIIVSVPVSQSNKYIADKEFLLYMNSLLLANIIDENLGLLPLRGAITKGNFYCDSEITFGKALVSAHRLESKKAITPRVLVDTDEFMPRDTKDYLESGRKFNQLLDMAGIERKFDSSFYQYGEFTQDRRKDHDGYIHCNYLSALRIIGGDWVSYARSAITTHKNFITKKLNETKSSDEVHEKYLWMKTYHNWFCSGFDELHDYKIQ